MQYTLNAASGDAGEYFFAYQIAHVLKWPCRLLDVDIGIDAQVEVLGENRTSSGRFIAIQVKARQDDGPYYRYVTEAQLAYWLELQIPVFVVMVKLNIPAKPMYLHEISKKVTYHRTKKKGMVRINFDKKNDVFNKKSATRLSLAYANAKMEDIHPWLEKVNEGSKAILECLSEPVDDKDVLLDLMRNRVALKTCLEKASSLVNASRIGEDEYQEAAIKLEGSLKRLARVMRSAGIHIDQGHGYHEVKTFLDEYL